MNCRSRWSNFCVFGRTASSSEKRALLDDELLTEMLIKIVFQTRKAEEIVTSVRSYAKEQKTKKSPLSVNEVVTEAG